MVSRRTPIVRSMRRSDQPNRPSAPVWWCLSSAKTLLMPRRNTCVPRRRQRLEPLLEMAGFQLSINGRIWMSTEDLADPASEAAATGWWTALTESGGEGAVVKPLSFVATGSRGLLQPAVKCRGASICGSSTGPSTPCPSTSRVCGSGVCRVNDRWPCVSSRWGSKASSASSRENLSGAFTSAYSAYSPWRASRSILGYRREVVIAASGVAAPSLPKPQPARGGTVGGTGPRARCSPLPSIRSMRVRLMRLQLRVRMLRANFNLRWDLLTVGFGRRSLPPGPIRSRRRGGQ